MVCDEKTLVMTLREIEGARNRESLPGMIAGAYALWLAGEREDVFAPPALARLLKESKLDPVTLQFVNAELGDHWDSYRSFLRSFDQGLLKQAIVGLAPQGCRSEFSHTPPEVLELMTRLLEIEPGEHVADLGAGAGEFLCHAYNNVPNAHYWGDEIDARAVAISMIRAKVLGGDITVVQENLFEPTQDAAAKFDKIFCFPPLGLRSIRMPLAENFIQSHPARASVIKGTVSGEWLFALKMLSRLKDGGKAVLVMSPGGLSGMPDNGIRHYLLQQKLVEAVILLPERLFGFTNMPIAAVVFSRDNPQIRMIDASDMGKRTRRNTVLTEEDVGRIVATMKGDKSELCADIQWQDAVKRGNMNPKMYTDSDLELRYTTKFGDIIKILRGAQLSSADLDGLRSEKPTEFRCLALGNIKDGMIDDNLPYLTVIDGKLLRFCLQPNDIVLSKIGVTTGNHGDATFKVALATPLDGQKILAMGNCFIIRVDEAAADPCYIKAFLESTIGQKVLRRISGGSAMPNLSAEAIKNMDISLPRLEQQQEIAKRYRAQADEVVRLRRQLATALDQLGRIWDADNLG